MAITYRIGNDGRLTVQEMDGNFQYIEVELGGLSSSVSQLEISVDNITTVIAGITASEAYQDATVIAGLTASVLALEGDVAGLTSDVASATASIATLNTNVASATASIATLNTNVASATASIVTLNTNVASATASIATLNTNVASATASIATLTSDVASATASIATLNRIFKGPFNNYTIEAEDIYTYVALQEATPLSGSTLIIDNDIFNKENGVCLFSAFQGDGVIQFSGLGTIANNGVEGLTTLIYNQGDVISIKYVGGEVYYVDIVNKSSGAGDVASATASIATLNTNVASATASIATLTSDVASATASIATLTSDVASATASIATLTSDVASATASIVTLNTNVASATASIATLNTNVAGLTASVIDLQNAFSSITGDFNLLLLVGGVTQSGTFSFANGILATYSLV